MTNNNFSSSYMNESWSEYNDAPGSVYLAFIDSLQTFPTRIANNIFNSLYAFGTVTNTVLLAYLIYYKRYTSPVFCVILSLGVADLVVCVTCLLHYYFVFPFIVGPLWLCNLTRALMYTSYLSSSYHIAVFAVLRFLQLVYPLTSHAKVTTSLLFRVCLLLWGIQSVQAIAFACYFGTPNIATANTGDLYVCIFIGNQTVRYVWAIIVWGLVPFIATGGFHVAKQVMVVLVHSANVTPQDEGAQQVRRQTASRALAIVIVVYLVTIIPYIGQSIRIYVLNITKNPLDVYILHVLAQFAYTNSAINPWIYLFAAESVRSDLIKMVTCNRKDRK